MPDKQSIKIIPQQIEKEPPWVNILLVSGGLLLLAILAPYFFAKVRTSRLEETKLSLENEITVLVNEYKEASQELVQTARRVNDFSDIFKEHRTTTAIFELLSSLCHPLAQFTNFEFKEENLYISLGVITENFKTLGEQFLVFEENEYINYPVVSGVALNRDGFVKADFEFYLDKGLIMPFSF